jgi:TolB-like protein/Flp pilus assembly protein TadD
MAKNNDNQSVIFKKALTRFVDECLQGKKPGIDEFVRQYPQCEDQLKKRIQDLKEIDFLFDTLFQADESEFKNTTDERDLVGKKVGSFEIKKIIGRGGMGTVYVAHDTKLDRSVAVKSVPAVLHANSTAQALFKSEAKLLASLNHPNIAVIHDIIEEDKSGYLVLEYIPGQTLAERIAHVPLKLHEALSIGQQIAEAVSAAHNKGVIHRDLKPGNIKIMPDGRVKVLDFGLAKVQANEDKPAETTVSQSGRLIGTPAYMSPEQVLGKDIDHRTDIWSFGCIMYEMMTDKHPFECETVTDTLARIVERQPDWELLPKEIPDNIRILLRRCLQKNRDERLGDIADAVSEIKEALSVPVPSVTTKFQKAAMIFGAFIIIIITAIIMRFIPRQQALPALEKIRLVVLPFENLGPAEDEYYADGITDAITARLAGLHGLSIISRHSAIQYKKCEKATRQIADELAVDYILEGTVQCEQTTNSIRRVRIIPQLIKASNDAHVWTEIYDDEMSEVFRLQSDLAERVAQTLDIALLEPEHRALTTRPTENVEAYEYLLQGEDYKNRSGLEKDFHERGLKIAIQMYERAVELDPSFALAFAKLCVAHCDTYKFNYDMSHKRLAQAKQAVSKALELDPDLPEAHQALGHYHLVQSDNDSALEQFEIARKSQPNNSETIQMIGYIQGMQGKFTEALANFNKALELSPLNFPLMTHAGYTCNYLHRYSEAERYFNHAISLAPHQSGPYEYKAWLYLIWEGSTEKARRVLAEALHNIEPTENLIVNYLVMLDIFDREYQKALDRLSSKPDDANDLQDFVRNCLKYGQIYTYMDKKEPAEKHYGDARSVLESKIDQQPEESWLHSSLGIAYAGLGRKQDAITEGNLAVKLASDNAMIYPYRIDELARIYVMVGEFDTALDQLELLLSRPAQTTIPLLRLDPAWDPLRNHPRFKKLIEADK